jgi:hypothetical protein
MIDFVKAKTFIGENKALKKLAEQNIQEIKITDPKTGKPFLEIKDDKN